MHSKSNRRENRNNAAVLETNLGEVSVSRKFQIKPRNYVGHYHCVCHEVAQLVQHVIRNTVSKLNGTGVELGPHRAQQNI